MKTEGPRATFTTMEHSTADDWAAISLHFVEFARLDANQASGDDAAICKAIIELAPTLTPQAAGM